MSSGKGCSRLIYSVLTRMRIRSQLSREEAAGNNIAKTALALGRIPFRFDTVRPAANHDVAGAAYTTKYRAGGAHGVCIQARGSPDRRPSQAKPLRAISREPWQSATPRQRTAGHHTPLEQQWPIVSFLSERQTRQAAMETARANSCFCQLVSIPARSAVRFAYIPPEPPLFLMPRFRDDAWHSPCPRRPCPRPGSASIDVNVNGILPS